MRNKIEIIVFLTIIIGFGAGYLFLPQREFSELENRYLSVRPEISWKSLLDGSYTEQFDSYTADQILGKDFLVQTNVAANRIAGVSRIQQVFIGRDGYLIQDYQEPDEQLEENLSRIVSFAAEHDSVDMTFLLAPNASEIYPEELPALAETYSQRAVAEEVQAALSPTLTVVDAREILLEHKAEGLYYKTDHHWNSLGAYYAYTALCESLGLTPTAREDYEIQTISAPFYGSLYSKAPLFWQEADTMELYRYPEGEYTVEYTAENRTADTMFDLEYADRKDKYAIYFGGNYPLTVIRSHAENQEKVLILKDSYANSLVPMLAEQYGEIHMIDLRYYHEDVGDYLEQEGITQVILIYNIDFLSTDTSFAGL